MSLRVFEIRNQTLRELFVGCSRRPLSEVVRRNRKRPPRILAHWDFRGHELVYTEIERDLPPADKDVFIRSYACASTLKGWRIIADHRK